MTTNYQCRYKDLDAEYNVFILELDQQIRRACAALLQAADEPCFQISLDEESLMVGEFEAMLNGYPALNAILIEPERILFQIEPDDEYHPMEDFEILTINDKLAILEIVEMQIREFY